MQLFGLRRNREEGESGLYLYLGIGRNECEDKEGFFFTIRGKNGEEIPACLAYKNKKGGKTVYERLGSVTVIDLRKREE